MIGRTSPCCHWERSDSLLAVSPCWSSQSCRHPSRPCSESPGAGRGECFNRELGSVLDAAHTVADGLELIVIAFPSTDTSASARLL